MSNLIKKHEGSWAVLVHTFNLSTCEAKADVSLS